MVPHAIGPIDTIHSVFGHYSYPYYSEESVENDNGTVMESTEGCSTLAERFSIYCPASPLVVSCRTQMAHLTAALPYIEIVLSLLLILGIVLQQRGASLGGAFGGDNFASTFYKRRGAEKFLFTATIVIAVLYVVATVVNLFIAR